MAVVETTNLTKSYGKLRAVDGLNLRIEQGSIFGFIGPNGAGKTTTLRILATLLQPTGGDATVCGYSVVKNPREVRRHLGYMPDFFGVYDDMKAWEYLDFYAACFKVAKSRRIRMVDDLLALVDLSEKKEAYVESLSRGMKQRLCLARALVHDPAVLLLDEPASGLDPRARVELRELLRELRAMGKTIVISSHILAELAELCSHIGIIERGRIAAAGSVDEVLRRRHEQRIVAATVIGGGDRAREVLAGQPGVRLLRPAVEQEGPEATRLTLEFGFDGDDRTLSELLAKLVGGGVPVVSFTERVDGLEDVFMKVTEQSDE
ncbi:MAG: ABC transporter ATP-binding protein [Chloroflexi bacterium]|nr:ABC transporter ATP-binding protein [Chloroflexota bacterium]